MARISTTLTTALLAAAWPLPARGQAQEPQPPRTIQVLILSGQNNHDWRQTTPILRDILERAGRFEVRVNEEPRGMTAATLAPYDLVLSNYNGPRWGEAAEQALLEFVRNGKGFALMHAANNAFGDWPEYDVLTGGGWRAGAGHGDYWSYPVHIEDLEHPITEGVPDFQHAPDELYHNLTLHPDAQLHILASAFSRKDKGGTGKVEPQVWVVRYGQGRTFHMVMGHDAQSMSDLGFVTLMQRGCEWAATGEVTIPVPAGIPPPEEPQEPTP